ncbi:MAG: signal peptide peptidase SppA [Desulfobacteraceae bacterium]|nr:MAG: signal peptide peptidase SppA [Desulfobacteraceae bacterium]
MFSRRHPYLFFLLLFTGMIAGSSVIVSMLTLAGDFRSDRLFAEKVGIIEIKGVISDARQVLEQIRDFRKDDDVKAIVVRIDSPGGGVGPSQEIYRELQKTVKVKKVIASMGAIAASGGYYIAAAADGIVANPGTITGSIGVILGYTNFESLFEKIGLYPVVIKSGEYKDIGSPVRKMTEPEQALLQEFSDNVHRQFIRDVATGRQQSEEEIRKIADGRIFSGETAKSLGLVDRLGNLEDAIEWAGELGGIEGEIPVVYPPKEKAPFMKYLMESTAEEINETVRQWGTSVITGGYVYQPEQGR